MQKQTDRHPQPTTVDEYLATLPDSIRETLETMRQTIKEAAPDAQELFSYQMPGFRFHGRFVWYAAFTNHYSLFVVPKALAAFKDELKSYKTTKSALQFPLSEPVPVPLVRRIITHAVRVNQEAAQLKALAKK